jgi:hypothetical protein
MKARAAAKSDFPVLEAIMTDPDLVFDMDPQNVHRVEQWIAERWPAAALTKRADGSRLTWWLQGAGGRIESIVATESFLSLPANDVDQHLQHARAICDDPSSAACLLLATDGARTVDAA